MMLRIVSTLQRDRELSALAPGPANQHPAILEPRPPWVFRPRHGALTTGNCSGKNEYIAA